MLEKTKISFEDLISKINPTISVKNIVEKSPVNKLLDNINLDNKENNKREKYIKEIIKVFNEKDNTMFSINKDYLYSSLLLIIISFGFLFGLISLSSIFYLLLGLPQTKILDMIIASFIIIISAYGTIKITSWLSKKMYNLFYKKSNKETFDILKNKFNIDSEDSPIYIAEYIYYFNKFEGGLENKKNIILLTYLIDKYGLKETTIEDCILSDRTRVPMLKDIFGSIRKIQILWFKHKTNKKINWENIYEEVDLFSKEQK